MTVTTGMVGQGFYNENSGPQLASIEYVLPWLEEAVAGGSVAADHEPATFADFGCSEGRNSITVMRRLIAAQRARADGPIATIHLDLPTNDFSELFAALRPDGASTFGPGVYSAAVGGSMFDQLLPPRTVRVATTFNAIGFLSRRPLDRLPGYILPNAPRSGVGQVSAEQSRIFAAQAETDLVAFGRARASELVPGGTLLVQVFGAGEQFRTCDGIYDVLNEAMLHTVAAGRLDQDSYERFYQPVYFRTLDELVAPYGPAGALRDAFRLEHAECYEVPVGFVEEFRRTGDSAALAEAYTAFFRAFTEAVLRLHLAARPAADAIIEEIYHRAIDLLTAEPERFEFHYVAVAALLTRS